MIYQGNVSAQAWKGYTGTGAVIGLASTRSIASHHSLHAIPHTVAQAQKQARDAKPKTKPAGMKPEMSAYLEAAVGKPIFYVNAVTGTQGRIVDVFAGPRERRHAAGVGAGVEAVHARSAAGRRVDRRAGAGVLVRQRQQPVDRSGRRAGAAALFARTAGAARRWRRHRAVAHHRHRRPGALPVVPGRDRPLRPLPQRAFDGRSRAGVRRAAAVRCIRTATATAIRRCIRSGCSTSSSTRSSAPARCTWPARRIRSRSASSA